MAERRSIGSIAVVAVAIVSLADVCAFAQILPGAPYGGSVETFYQTWDIDEGTTTTKIKQAYVPINLFLPISDRFEARLSSAYVSMTRDTEFDESETVSGLADVKVQANAVFLQRRLILGVVANLPSGSGELTSLEQDVVYDFVSPDLSVRTNRLGEGFNIGGTISFANALSETITLGLGASVLSRGAYDTALPGISAPISLSPGLESRAGVTLDVVSGPNEFRLSSTVAVFGTEQVNDADNYKIGPELSIAADYRVGYARGRGSFTLGVVELLRFDNSNLSSGTFGIEQTSTNGNYLVARGANEYALSSSVRVSVSALGRLVGPNEFDVGDSTVMEGGLALTFLPTSDVALTAGGRYVSGSGTGFSGRDRDITGLEGLVRIVVRLQR